MQEKGNNTMRGISYDRGYPRPKTSWLILNRTKMKITTLTSHAVCFQGGWMTLKEVERTGNNTYLTAY